MSKGRVNCFLGGAPSPSFFLSAFPGLHNVRHSDFNAVLARVRYAKFALCTWLRGVSILTGFTNWRRRQLASVLHRRLGLDASGQHSSLSDESSYVSVVTAASSNERFFRHFRSHPNYLRILDHVSQPQGKAYIHVLQQRGALSPKVINELKAFSTIGGPQTFHFRGFGRLSPSLLRYMKVASDLQLLFPDIGTLSVGEIGIGWGGQTWVLYRLAGVRRFSLFDLPEVNVLSQNVFSRIPLREPDIKYFDARSRFPREPLDLVLSNYAFSELSRKEQRRYLEAVVRLTPRGYITWNALSPDGYSVQELLEAIPGATAVPETPLTHKGNVIITWGHQANASFS